MGEVRFYHLTTSRLESALPRLLEKTLERGRRALVLAGSTERVEALADWLWRYKDRSFLPHGTARDGHPADQPVWLSEQDDNPNGAQYLFLTDGARSERIADFELTALLFDGNDAEALASARAQWRALKQAGHRLTYWQQDAQGGWRQSAEA